MLGNLSDMKFFKSGRSTGLSMGEYNDVVSSVKVDLLAKLGTYRNLRECH